VDGLAILQVLITPFVIYVLFITAKIAIGALRGKWTEISKEKAFLLLCIAVLLAGIQIVGTIGTLVEYWQRAS
jgi:hypothetical protein